jgi:hypothetical protein
MIEFSSVAMPITAPGGDQVLRLLEALDKRGQVVVDRLVGMQRVGAVSFSDRLAKPIEEAGEKAAHASVNFEHLGVRGAFAAAQLAQGAEQGIRPFAHQLAMVGGAFGPVSLAVTTFVAIAGEQLIDWFMRGREEAEKFEKQIVSTERKLGEGGDLRATAKEMQALFSGDKFRDGDDPLSKAVRGGGIQALQRQLAPLRAEYEKLAATTQIGLDRRAEDIPKETLARMDKLNSLITPLDAQLRQMQEMHERLQRIYDDQAKAFGNQTRSGAQLEREKKDQEERKAFHDDVVSDELDSQNQRNRLRREAYERESAETLRILEEGWAKEKEAREAHDKAVIAEARKLAGDIGSATKGIIDGFLEGGLGGGLEALKDQVLAGIGEILIGIGTTMIAASPWLKAAAASLLSLSGAGSLAAGIGLVALGATLVSAGSGAHGGHGGGTYGGSSIGSTMASGLVSVGPASAPNMSGVRAAAPVVVQATFFGKHDLEAARNLADMIDLARSKRM